jgi:hypothetical protein
MFGGSHLFSSSQNDLTPTGAPPPDAVEADIRREATDAFLRFQAMQPAPPDFLPPDAPADIPACDAPPPDASESLDAPLAWPRRLIAEIRALPTRAAPPHRAGFFWTEVFRVAADIPGALPSVLVPEIFRDAPGRPPAPRGMLAAIGRAFPELAAGINPAPLRVGPLTQTHTAAAPNGGTIRLTLRHANARRLAHEAWIIGAKRACAFIRRAGGEPERAIHGLHLAAEHIRESFDCRRRARAMESWASAEFDACALRPLPELTSDAMFAVVEGDAPGVAATALAALSSDARARIVGAMWKRLARHAFEKGLFHADGGTHHWRFIDEKCIYVGVDFVGELTPAERDGWMKALATLLARDAKTAAERLSALFSDAPVFIAEARLRDCLAAPPAQAARLTRLLGECLSEQTLSSGALALLRTLATLERWSASVAPHFDPLPSFFIALQEMQAGQIFSSAIASPSGIGRAARDYFSLLRGSFKAGLERFVSAAPAATERSAPPVAPSADASSPSPSPASPSFAQPTSRPSLARPIAFQAGLCALVVLQWTNPHPLFGVPTPIGTLHADVALALVLCAVQARTLLSRKR